MVLSIECGVGGFIWWFLFVFGLVDVRIGGEWYGLGVCWYFCVLVLKYVKCFVIKIGKYCVFSCVDGFDLLLVSGFRKGW